MASLHVKASKQLKEKLKPTGNLYTLHSPSSVLTHFQCFTTIELVSRLWILLTLFSQIYTFGICLSLNLNFNVYITHTVHFLGIQTHDLLNSPLNLYFINHPK